MGKSNQVEQAMRSPSGADLVLLLLLVMFGFGIWTVVERGVTELLRSREPSEQKIMDAHGVTKQKAELADMQNEASEMQKYLNTARLEQVKQGATLQSFMNTYPELTNGSLPRPIPAELLKAYQEASRQSGAADAVVNSLEKNLNELKSKIEPRTAELETRQQAAESEFRWARWRYVVLKRVGTFVVTLAIVFGLLWLVRVALWLLAKNRRMSTAEGFRPFAFALAALVVLFAYDQFGLAGAALVGIVLLLLVLRRINWPGKSDALAK